MKLFRVRGITLEVHPAFYLLPLLLGYDGYQDGRWAGVADAWWALFLVYACVVLHEFGHALMARRLGIPVERIMLLPIGGMALLGRMPRSAGKELLIVAAGPLVNFTIAGVCYALLGHFPTDVDAIDPGTLHAVDILQFLLVANLALGLFNLVPAFPMDGGRVLRALLAFRYDYLKATWIALWVGRVVALLGILLALAVLHAYLLAALFGFVLFLGDLEYTQLRREQQRAEFTAWIER